MTTPPFHLPEHWPRPHDPGAAERLVERFSELGRAEARAAARPAVRAMLAALGGNSPYLADLAVRESAALRALIADGPGRRSCRPRWPTSPAAAGRHAPRTRRRDAAPGQARRSRW